jgi:uncharacterized protein (UPF0332 family)
VTRVEGLLIKAERSARVARRLVQDGDNDDACSRAYYAIFDAARAALENQNRLPGKTHAGVHAAFAETFVKTGQFDRELGKALGKVENIRLLADYEDGVVGQDKAEWAVGQAEDFVRAVRLLLNL